MLNTIKLACACAALALSACGVETAGSAATAGAIKQQEIRQGRETLDKVNQQLEQANQAAEERLRQADEAGR
jgi:FtsZ-binding cell division protein ZapB